MTWLAIKDFGDYSTVRLEDSITSLLHAAPTLLPVGTLVMECAIGPAPDRQTQLLHRIKTAGWHRELAITHHSEGHISVETVQGPSSAYTYVPFAVPASGGNFRISYSWDAPCRLGCLSIVNIDTEETKVARVLNPLPLPREDLSDLMCNQKGTSFDPCLEMIAVADHIAVPIQKGGFCGDTAIETAQGLRRVDALMVGDKVLTEGKQFRTVCAIRRNEIPATRFTKAVELRAPFFGLTHTTLVSPTQKFQISGPTIEYLFGFEDVLVEARHLLAHPAAGVTDSGDFETYFEIELDEPHCIRAGGAWAECRDANGNGCTAGPETIAVVDFRPRQINDSQKPALNGHEAVSLLNAMGS